MRRHHPTGDGHARTTGAAGRGPHGTRRPRPWSRCVAAAAGLLLLAGCTQHVAGSGTLLAGAAPLTPTAVPTPTTPPLPGSDCAQGKVTTTAKSPAAVVLTASPDKLPADPAQTQPKISLMQLILSPANTRIEGSREFLESVGYVTGTERAWIRGRPGSPGSRAEYLTVYEFTDSAGACAFTKWETDNYEYAVNPDYAAIGMVGSHTPTDAAGGLQSAGYLASKGRFVIEAGVVSFATPGTPGTNVETIARFSASLLNMQYQRV